MNVSYQAAKVSLWGARNVSESSGHKGVAGRLSCTCGPRLRCMS